jgi:hypothetical protein
MIYCEGAADLAPLPSKGNFRGPPHQPILGVLGQEQANVIPFAIGR